MPQLRMTFDADTDPDPLPDCTLPDGFAIRPWRPEDTPAYLELRKAAEFDSLPGEPELLDYLENLALPEGLLVVVEEATGKIVASAAAQRSQLPEPDDELGCLAWTMTHPDYRERGLASAVSAQAMALCREQGYRTLYLVTDDWRLPAISVFLSLGWRPWLYQDDMEDRWTRIYAALSRLPDF